MRDQKEVLNIGDLAEYPLWDSEDYSRQYARDRERFGRCVAFNAHCRELLDSFARCEPEQEGLVIARLYGVVAYELLALLSEDDDDSCGADSPADCAAPNEKEPTPPSAACPPVGDVFPELIPRRVVADMHGVRFEFVVPPHFVMRRLGEF